MQLKKTLRTISLATRNNSSVPMQGILLFSGFLSLQVDLIIRSICSSTCWVIVSRQCATGGGFTDNCDRVCRPGKEEEQALSG